MGKIFCVHLWDMQLFVYCQEIFEEHTNKTKFQQFKAGLYNDSGWLISQGAVGGDNAPVLEWQSHIICKEEERCRRQCRKIDNMEKEFAI